MNTRTSAAFRTGFPAPNARGRLLAALMVAAAGFSAGCGSQMAEGERATDGDRVAAVPAEEPAPTLHPAGEALRPETAAANAAAVVVYRSRLEPKSGGGAAFMRVEREEGAPLPGAARSWRVRRSVASGPEGPWKVVEVQSIVMTGAGDAAVTEDEDKGERVVTVFDPPLVVMPRELRAGELFSQHTFMRVYPENSRTRTKAQGPATSTIEHLGAESVKAGTGVDRGAQKVVQTLRASLRPAEVVNVTSLWIVPGEGTIAEETEERTRVLGVQARHNRESWVMDTAR